MRREARPSRTAPTLRTLVPAVVVFAAAAVAVGLRDSWETTLIFTIALACAAWGVALLWTYRNSAKRAAGSRRPARTQVMASRFAGVVAVVVGTGFAVAALVAAGLH